MSSNILSKFLGIRHNVLEMSKNFLNVFEHSKQNFNSSKDLFEKCNGRRCKNVDKVLEDQLHGLASKSN